MTKATFGTISHGTLRNEDLLIAFANELERLSSNGAIPPIVAEARGIAEQLVNGEDEEEAASEIVNDLCNYLDEYAPDYGYFGAHPGDGSDFGFWLSEDWQQQAKDDGVLFVNDLADIPEDYEGTICLVNDHGNATLMHGNADKAEIIWSVV
jgi:hypothetical protein